MGDRRPKKCWGTSVSDVRGFGAILATSSNNRGREANKELMNLCEEIIALKEDEENEVDADGNTKNKEEGGKGEEPNSLLDELKNEIAAARENSKKKSTKGVQSIQTNAKGLILIKVNSKKITATEIVKAIFERVVNEKMRISRHLIQVIPLDVTFFPDEATTREKMITTMEKVFPGCSQGVEWDRGGDLDTETGKATEEVDKREEKKNPVTTKDEVSVNKEQNVVKAKEEVMEDNAISTCNKRLYEDNDDKDKEPRKVPEFKRLRRENDTDSRNMKEEDKTTIAVAFKRRNCNRVTRELVQHLVYFLAKGHATVDYKKPKNTIIFETFQSMAGISILTEEYVTYESLNLRKFQDKILVEE